jgi:hypothetical protein
MSFQRLEMAQPGVAGQHRASAGPRRFGGRLDELAGGLRAAQAGAGRGRGAAGRVISAATAWAAWPWAA